MKTTPKIPLVSHQFTYQDKPLRMLQDTCETCSSPQISARRSACRR